MALGEIVMGLVIFRLIWGLMGSATARFGTFVQGPKAVIGYLCALRRGELPLTVGHNPAGALMIIALLVLLAAQVGTGLFANDDIFSEGPLAKLYL
jgi:cytochrome b